MNDMRIKNVAKLGSYFEFAYVFYSEFSLSLLYNREYIFKDNFSKL